MLIMLFFTDGDGAREHGAGDEINEATART